MFASLSPWFRSFIPAWTALNPREWLRASLGAFIGIGITGAISFAALGNTPDAVWLIAPMGASTVLLFAVPASPLAQPWSAFGGNLVAALVGVTCVQLIPSPVIAAAVAISLAIAGMILFRCVHPPSGAVALTVVLGGPVIHAAGYGFILHPLGVNTLLLLAVALAYNNLTGRRYPHVVPSVPKTASTKQNEARFNDKDLDSVLHRYGQSLDVTRDDLMDIFTRVENEAYARRFGSIDCASIMSKDFAVAHPDTKIEQAWQLMQQQTLKVLPIVDAARHVIGIITALDFVEHAEQLIGTTFVTRLRALLSANSPRTAAHKATSVADIMTRQVLTARTDQALVELAPLMAKSALRFIPVLDNEARIVGIIAQGDMIRALYEHNLLGNNS